MPVKQVAVIGAGTIGASWAACFLARGLSVVASDPAPDAEAFIRNYIETAWPTLVRLGLAPGASIDRFRFERDPVNAVNASDFVQESAPERIEVKVELFERLDRALPPEVILASSSSGLLISDIAERCRHPERCIIGHPFNPPHMIPLVEVVGGRHTSPAIIERALVFYREIGKRPIHVRKEMRGHLVNRLQAALWREAIHLVAEGVASVADVDAGIAYGPGLRWAIMGPHLTFHLAGGEGGMTHFMPHIGVPLARDWWPVLGNPELTPAVQKKITEGVEDEADGRTIAELAAERDRCLIAILEALKTAREGVDT
jgi:3-hydroxyacyl-CoA dehydrogenase